MKTHYELIGIQPAAEADEVKRAFRREIARYHPDKVQHLGAEFQEMAAARAAALTEAYRVLMDSHLRERYDAALQQHGTGREEQEAQPGIERRADARSDASRSTQIQDTRAAKDSLDAVNLVRRMVAARLAQAVLASGGTMLEGAGFDWMLLFEGARSLFRKPEPSVRVVVRIVSTVSADAINDAWPLAARLSTADETLCLMILGSGMAPAGELSVAVRDMRNKTRRAGPVVVPVDVRDWEPLLPAETPAVVRVLLDRLRRRD